VTYALAPRILENPAQREYLLNLYKQMWVYSYSKAKQKALKLG
jgi:hypothetical protein